MGGVLRQGARLGSLAEVLRDVLRWIICAFGRCPPTTVVLLRHADVDLPPATDDDPLNPDGQTRASTLVHVLGDVVIDAIYVSTYRRTQQTAEPLANHLGLTPQVWTASAADLADEILDDHRGGTVVVVGHSNTVPQVISGLGASWSGTIAADEFDNLFWVTLPANGRNRVFHLHYGAET
jgi:broad specificity phosphatase PhoE